MNSSIKQFTQPANQLRLGRALRLAWESSPRWTIASVIMLVLQGLMPLGTLFLMKMLIDAVAAGIAAADKAAAMQHVIMVVLLSGAFAYLSVLLESVGQLVSEAQGQMVTNHMQTILHVKANEVDLEFYENTEHFDAMHRAQEEAPFRPTRIVRGMAQVGQNTISMIAIASLLISLNWIVALIVFATTLPSVFFQYRFTHEMYQWRYKRTALTRRVQYFNTLLTHAYFAKELRLFGLGNLFMGRSRDLREQLRKEQFQISKRKAIREGAIQAFVLLAIFGTYSFIAYKTIYGAITLGGMVMYYQAFQRGQSSMQSILKGLVGLYEDNLFLSNLFEFLDLKPKIAEPALPRPLPKPMLAGVSFNNVSFQYPRTERWALQDINLDIRPGEVVALVGENGSGKTTLVKLLCRLYDPTGGSVTIDGTDLKQFNTTDLRREISVVFQDYVHYHLTARENIWFGNLDLPSDHDYIQEAARASGADTVLSRFDKGYETVLGKWLEDGEELSIGEWQKIAIARAFLRNAEIMILDEPTSALDPKAEFEVFERFRQLIEGRTAILISHRLSTVRMADRIYVMENGRIVESGSHDELMKRGENYAHLFETQAQYYR